MDSLTYGLLFFFCFDDEYTTNEEEKTMTVVNYSRMILQSFRHSGIAKYMDGGKIFSPLGGGHGVSWRDSVSSPAFPKFQYIDPT